MAKETTPSAFDFLTFINGFKGGAQKKAKDTGFYKDPNGNAFALKKSEDFPADNIAEVVTSSLLTTFIKPLHSVGYEFKRNNYDNSFYLQSEVKANFTSLGSLLKGKKGLLHGWIKSNPATYKNKQNIQNCFEDTDLSKGGNPATLKNDMAQVLAGCLLVGDVDCQVENICIYTDTDSQRRIAKFDDGWGLANLCHPDNARVDLFSPVKWYGDKATHKNSLLPTNHFIDYPFILHSVEFADALKSVAHQSQFEGTLGALSVAFKKIDDAYSEDDSGRRQAYVDLARHLSLPIAEVENLEAEDIREMLHIKLSQQLDSRAHSMLILSLALKIKIKIDENPNNTDSADVTAMALALEAILKETNPPHPLPSFEGANEPFKQTKAAKQALKTVFDRIERNVKPTDTQPIQIWGKPR